MANRHFGEIGDVWKHLALAEILVSDKFQRYWESHAGSARYSLTHSPARDYGVFYFFDHALESVVLSASAYDRILRQYERNGELATYPASPLIAMTLLKDSGTSFVFCDIDEESLLDIRGAAEKIGLGSDVVRTVKADGVPTLLECLHVLSDQETVSTLAFVDPYRPFVKSQGGCNSIELFCRLTSRGVKTAFWYSYGAYEYRATLFTAVQRSFAVNRVDPLAHHVWCGDVSLVAIDDPTFDDEPGTLGCGVLCSNLSAVAISACRNLGEGLAGVYSDARFPSGHTGAIRFTLMFVAGKELRTW